MADKTPSEITRETLRLLSTRQLAPNPANFRAAYNEVSGIPDVVPFPDAPMREILQALPARTSAQQRHKGQLESAIRRANWNDVQSALIGYAAAASAPAAPVAVAAPPPPEPTTPRELFEPIARLVENLLPALGTDDARIGEQAGGLIDTLRGRTTGSAPIKTLLANFGLRASFVAEDQAEIRALLSKLLQLIIENISELSVDDQWLKRQIDALRDAATPPMTLRRLDDVERRIKDVMLKQIDAKGRAHEAQEEMRRMVATFIERLALITEATGENYRRMENSAQLIEQATSLEEIGPLLKSVVATTRDIAHSVRRTHEELHAMREKVQTTEVEINRLHDELDSVSTQARHDTLTGALNRKGLDEALLRELAEVRRKNTRLCIAMLDIDNFKKLNDTRGHATGDAALSHIANVTRESMRPQDTLARYGGEEFVILMPDTQVEQGIEAMTRLQRELTRRFFLSGDQKIIITFSAGVTLLALDEAAPDAIKRADQAMYLAKRAGKNRVVGA